MTKKRYEVKGMMEWHPVFAVGRARLQVSFTGGYLGDGCSTPAAYETGDPVIQHVIEHSDAFRKGRIRLAWSRGRTAPSPAKKEKADKVADVAAPVAASLFEADAGCGEEKVFDNEDEAIDYVQEKTGVGRSHIMTAAECCRVARQYGINIRIKR